jgi:hypothetical protein
MGMRKQIELIIEAKYGQMVDEVVAEIRNLPIDHMQSGQDSALNSVWEEFVFQIQGEESVIFSSYEEVIENVCLTSVEKLTDMEVALLWLGSDNYWNRDEAIAGQAQKREDVVDELYQRIKNRAGDEELNENVADQELDEPS